MLGNKHRNLVDDFEMTATTGEKKIFCKLVYTHLLFFILFSE